MTTLKTPDQLTNAEYQELPEVSGSILAAIHNDCPAQWRYGEPKESPALAEGIAAHVALLEHHDFDARFYRVPEPQEGDLVTARDLQAWLKAAGIKGYSGKKKEELIDIILETGDKPPIYDLIVEQAERENEGKTGLGAEVFDRIDVMRRTLRNDPEYDAKLTGGQAELSCIDADSGLKCRWDYITSDGEIWDYKTTTSSHPDQFAAQAHRVGYWLKMALQADLFERHYGFAPRRVVLLAQSKKAPYIPQAYELTPDQLAVGREMYQQAHRVYQNCVDLDSWPAYGGGIQELPTPGWVAKMYQMGA